MKFGKEVIAVMVAGAIIGLSGCSSNGNNTRPSETRLSELENQLKEKTLENESLRTSVAELQNRKADSTQEPTPAVTATDDDLLPPKAQSGECYARVWVPASYRDVKQQKLVREESERIEIIPAEYRWNEENVLVKEASSRLETVPAVYETKTERMLVSPAVRAWKVSSARDAAPASDAILAAAKEHGVDLDEARPGMCFHEHYIPAKYKTSERQVLVAEAGKQIDVSAPKYRWIEKRVLVQEASSRIEVVPASYQWVEESVIDKPAHTIWQKGTGPIQRIDESTGEIMCLVEVPATYKTIRKKIVVTPASTRKVAVPAQYKTIKVRELIEEAGADAEDTPARYETIQLREKVADASFVWHEVHNTDLPASTRTGHQICLHEHPAKYKQVPRRVIKTPATTRKVDIPAKYETVKVRKLVADAQEKRIKIPAEYETVVTRELDAEGRMEWRSILCETNMTTTRITQIQRALKRAGYNPGKIDGVIGGDTMAAVNAFQRDQGLPVDRYLNLATLKALGVSPR